MNLRGLRGLDLFRCRQQFEGWGEKLGAAYYFYEFKRVSFEMRIRFNLIKIFLFLLLLNGCSDQESSKVYIPGPELKQSLEISISDTQAPVGKKIILHAERRSSGFVEVQEAEPEDGCAFTSKPPEFEGNVALNVLWKIEPEDGSYEFSFTESGERTIKFSKKGTYSIQARSSLWCPPGILSNKLVIEVSD